jgi:23S rRNA pseudouridine1911/1915/1917 synthase
MNRSGRSGPRKPGRSHVGGRNEKPNDRNPRPEHQGKADRNHVSAENKGRPEVFSERRGKPDPIGPRQPDPRGAGTQAVLKMGRFKGEWMEIRLPDSLAGAPMQAVMKQLPLPPKLTSKLMHERGLLLQGPSLRLHLFPRERRDFPPDWMELNILYEDEFTLVVNKPAGIEVHPSEHGQRRTLAHGVSAYYEMSGQEVRIRHIHRIDKETTGPVLYAKNEFAHYQYDKAMREKRIERVYLALAEGVIKQDKGIIDKPIGQDRHHSTRRRVSETGDSAVTHYQVVERFADHTLVRLQLETGRTHQIRVHMAAIGHPLAGDGMYGGTRKIMARQALHGEKLIWLHPWTGEKQQVRAPLPDDFSQALERLRQPL